MSGVLLKKNLTSKLYTEVADATHEQIYTNKDSICYFIRRFIGEIV